MEILEQKKFKTAGEIVRYAGENRITIVSITQDQDGYTLFFRERLF